LKMRGSRIGGKCAILHCLNAFTGAHFITIYVVVTNRQKRLQGAGFCGMKACCRFRINFRVFMGSSKGFDSLGGGDNRNSSAAKRIRTWVVGLKLSTVACDQIVSFFDPVLLESAPRLSKWNWRGAFIVQECRRYLWYRHTARLCSWKERTKFPEAIAAIVKQEVYPDDVRDGATETSDHVARGGTRDRTRAGERSQPCHDGVGTSIRTYSEVYKRHGDGEPLVGVRCDTGKCLCQIGLGFLMCIGKAKYFLWLAL
jgi:hypothetical protein